MAGMTLEAFLRLNTQQFSQKLKDAGDRLSDFAKAQGKMLKDQHAGYAAAQKSIQSFNRSLSDVSNITRGIIISQTFYEAARSIREAVSALSEFNEQLDYAQVTYSALFGDATLASDFLKVLQEHSVGTIFEFSDLEKASKKLLAYGIEYKNLMFIMEGLTNIGAMSGDAAGLERISLALGQIYTRGKLGAQEMLQLANAYVPIYDIIQQKFGLSGEDMGRVGDLNLPAHEVINAVVDYANEKFGSVGDAAMYTITGLKNRIVDTFKVLGNSITQPITRAFKSFLLFVSNGLDKIRDAYASGGLGGIFEHLVPDKNMQTLIRQFLANVHNLFMSLVRVGAVAGQVFGNFGIVFMSAFNAVVPVITGLINTLTTLMHVMLQNASVVKVLRVALLAAAAGFVIMRATAVSALVVTAVTKAVAGLAKMLIVLASLVTKHPILMLLAGLAIALVGVRVASDGANSAVSGLFDTLSSAGGGMSQEDVFKNIAGDISDASDAADQFNNRLEDSSNAAEDLEDAINGAGKAAKKTGDLLSFDEVFRLREPASTSGGGEYAGLVDDIGNLIDGLGGLGDAFIPDIPDFSEFIKDFTDGLFGGLEDGLLGKLALGGLAAILGKGLLDAIGKVDLKGLDAKAKTLAAGIMKALSGALLGLAFDQLVDPLTDKLWDALEEAFKLDDDASIKADIGATIGSIIGGAIGMVIGGLKGGIIGAAIGQLAGGIVGLAWDEIKGAFNNTITGLGAGIAQALAKAWGGSFSQVVSLIDFSSVSAMFSSIGQILKGAGLKAVAKGGLIGMAIGLVTDAIAALLWKGLAEKFELGEGAIEAAKIGQTIGSVIGTIIGGIIGGPVGALIGGAVGTFAGGLVGLFKDKIVAAFENFDIAGGIGGALIGALIGLIGGPVGAVIGALGGSLIGGFFEGIKAAMANIGSWIRENIFDPFVEWFKNLFGIHSPSTVMREFGIHVIQGFFNGLVEAWLSVTAWLTETLSAFTTWVTNVAQTITGWATETKQKFTTWADETLQSISGWAASTTQAIFDWAVSIKQSVSDWYAETKQRITVWATETLQGISTWAANTKQSIVAWVSETKQTLTTWATEAKQKLTTWATETKQALTTWATEAKQKLTTWATETKQALTTWAAEAKQKLTTWAAETKQALTTWAAEAKQKLTTWATETKQTLTTWATEAKQKLATWATETKQALTTWATEAKQKLTMWATETKQSISTWASETKQRLSTWSTEVKQSITTWVSDTKQRLASWSSETRNTISTWVTDAKTRISEFFTLENGFSDFCSRTFNKISEWASNIWSSIKSTFNNAISKVKEFLNLESSASSAASYSSSSGYSSSSSRYNYGHATGGIFDREHIARFAEGNKAEAIIPLENKSAMQPFVDAVAGGLLGSLAPIIAQGSTPGYGGTQSETLPPLYVGTLIADDRGLKELYKRFEIIKVQENARKGLA